MTVQQQQPPSGHHLAERTPFWASQVGQMSLSVVISSFLPGQPSPRKHRVLPRETWCLHLYSMTMRVHMMAAAAARLRGSADGTIRRDSIRLLSYSMIGTSLEMGGIVWTASPGIMVARSKGWRAKRWMG
ncbi:hypothetical protein DCS_05449 [Drechmeria coniospora]|uniref:Uncharacterized protein n=1 Tax=Drechmeria coniospora TaxID=98403 RepID=A0A151GMT3_DRECN|nr:hypothetical protein DCS_05449 [Drechmeria coniospora]KYK58434.1 hypothetical protein DCS_05449 [Drechmeria coniospora]